MIPPRMFAIVGLELGTAEAARGQEGTEIAALQACSGRRLGGPLRAGPLATEPQSQSPNPEPI